MKAINGFVITCLIFGYAVIIPSCKKQTSTVPPVIQNDDTSMLSSLQASVSSLKKQCDSLSAGLTQQNAAAVTLNTNISNLVTIPEIKQINVDSIKTLVATVISQSCAFTTQTTAISAQIASFNNSSVNAEMVTQKISELKLTIKKLNQQYASLSTQLALAESETENVVRTALGTRSYIAIATAQNVANYVGDVIVCPGYYLSVYTHFYTSSSDIAPTIIAARKSTDTTGTLWGSEYTVSSNIARLNVSGVTLRRIDANTVNCYFLVKNSTADTRLYLTVSPDNGTTWSPPTQVIYENAYDIIMNNSVHTINNGRIVIPVASTPVASAGYIFTDYCLYSDDGGVTWSKSTQFTPTTPAGGLEPRVVQLSGDTCLMNIRTSSGFQYFSLSTDNCKTWGAPYKGTLVSSYSPAVILNVSGKLIAIHNNSPSFRNPLTISVSADRGATWRRIEDIETGSTSIYGWSYPSATVSNGYLILSYYETVNEPKPISMQYYHLKFNKIKISTLGL